MTEEKLIKSEDVTPPVSRAASPTPGEDVGGSGFTTPPRLRTPPRVKTPPKTGSSTWHVFKGFKLDKSRFRAGVVLVEPGNASVQRVTEKRFSLKDRELYIVRADESNDLTGASQNRKSDSYLNATRALFKKLDPSSDEPNVFVCNAKRKDEVFAPLLMGEQGKEFGLYVYPWMTSSLSKANLSQFQFSGFQEFVTAVCLLGSSLVGVDQHGASFPLIKHCLPFFPTQKVQEIAYKPDEDNPYELLVLAELEKSAAVINKFSEPGVQKSLRIHLPWLDYVLFGIELFTRGKITFNALTDFTQIILDKRDDSIEKISAIIKPHGIKVTFESPFDNLLALSPEQYSADILLHTLFAQLGLKKDEVDPASVTEELQKESEGKLVANCLKLLLSQNKLAHHHQAWTLLKGTAQFREPVNLEDLFKLANAAMLAASSIGKKEYKVCSLLPLSEKQIQLSYSTYCKLSDKVEDGTKALPGVFMMTFLEPLNGYQATSTNECSMFYYPPIEHPNLNKAITKYGLLEAAFRNVFLFAQKKAVALQKPAEVADVLHVSTTGSSREAQGSLETPFLGVRKRLSFGSGE